MKRNILTATVLASMLMASCQKNLPLVKSTPLVEAVKSSTKALIVPVGFKWENARNIAFSVAITDLRFGSKNFTISIFDSNPATGGKLLTKGTATTAVSYKTKLYLANTIQSVFIVKISPDNKRTSMMVPVAKSNITTSIGN